MVIVHRLVWNPWNIAHIAKHQVTPNEVEQVRQGNYLTLQSYHSRFILIGPTAAGRVLAVVIEPKPQTGLYFPVSARPASRKERRLYQAWRGGEDR